MIRTGEKHGAGTFRKSIHRAVECIPISEDLQSSPEQSSYQAKSSQFLFLYLPNTMWPTDVLVSPFLFLCSVAYMHVALYTRYWSAQVKRPVNKHRDHSHPHQQLIGMSADRPFSFMTSWKPASVYSIPAYWHACVVHFTSAEHGVWPTIDVSILPFSVTHSSSKRHEAW